MLQFVRIIFFVLFIYHIIANCPKECQCSLSLMNCAESNIIALPVDAYTLLKGAIMIFDNSKLSSVNCSYLPVEIAMFSIEKTPISVSCDNLIKTCTVLSLRNLRGCSFSGSSSSTPAITKRVAQSDYGYAAFVVSVFGFILGVFFSAVVYIQIRRKFIRINQHLDAHANVLQRTRRTLREVDPDSRV